MKKLLYTFLAVSIIFATCKKEDDSSSPNGGTNNTSGSILGKWDLTQYNVTSSEGYYTNYPNGKVTTWDTTFSITPPDSDFEIESITWEFFNDQTMEEILTEYGNPDSTDLSYYTWIKNGNTLALDTDWVVTINTLTANNLNWTDDSEDTSSYSYYGGGDTVYFNREIGIASWNKVLGLSPNKSNARLKQGNTKKSILRKFINRRKK